MFNNDLFFLRMKRIIERDWKLSNRPSVVFDQYPVDPNLFKNDLIPYIDKIINTHGHEEWKAAILTNEMHRHLGIYSLMGVKMGILARELLQTSMDDIRVEAYTGNIPPVSCMADGLQVATGASLGRGTITVMDDPQPRPEAIFVYDQIRLKLSLKDFYREKIESSIITISHKYPTDSSPYFDQIRKISIKYWLEFSRSDIFEAVQFEERLKKVN